MVDRISRHARRSAEVLTRRFLIDVINPPITATQSRQKNTSSATAVATCTATRNARYGDFSAVMLKSWAHWPPTRAGTRIEWPRLDTGNSSVTPWKAPTTIASM